MPWPGGHRGFRSTPRSRHRLRKVASADAGGLMQAWAEGGDGQPVASAYALAAKPVVPTAIRVSAVIAMLLALRRQSPMKASPLVSKRASQTASQKVRTREIIARQPAMVPLASQAEIRRGCVMTLRLSSKASKSK